MGCERLFEVGRDFTRLMILVQIDPIASGFGCRISAGPIDQFEESLFEIRHFDGGQQRFGFKRFADESQRATPPRMIDLDRQCR